MANKDTLKDIRNKIDQLDLSILKSLSQRVELVIKAGKIKKFSKDTSFYNCLLYTSPSPRDLSTSRMPSSA